MMPPETAPPGDQDRVTDSAASLARETPFTVDERQDAINALGGRAATLLPTVKDHAARLHMTPYVAACRLLNLTTDIKGTS